MKKNKLGIVEVKWKTKNAAYRLPKLFVTILKILNREDMKIERHRKNAVDLAKELAKLFDLWGQTERNRKQCPEKLSVSNLFLIDFERNLINTLDSLKRVLRSSKLDESMHWRSKLTIRLVYIHAELLALFPNGEPVNEFTFIRPEAQEWWRNVFGDCLCVSWPVFIKAFSRSFHMTGRREIEKLHETIAFSSDFYVSVFGWDVFNRLFAPWNLLVPAWTKLVYEHPGYMAWMTFEDMRNFLSRYRLSPGTYAFRMSCRSIGFWSVAYVDASGKVIQSVCRSQNFADFLEEGIKRGKFAKPIGSQENTDLGELTKQVLTHRVTMHKLELYSSRESFMSCSICFDAPRTTRMEPCGHLFCAACTQSWLDRENCCPICRTQVIATSPVKIEFEGESEDDKRKLFITTMEKEGSWTSLNSCASSNRGSIPLLPTPEESNQKTLTVVTGRRSMELITAPKENCEETPPLTIVLQNVPGPRETYRNSRSRTLPETIVYSRTDAMGDNTPATAFRRKSDQTNRSPRIITISDANATENSTPATASTGKPDQTNGSLKIISIKQVHKDSDEQDKIDHLTSAGWSEPDVRRALRVSNGDVVVAENILHEFVKQ